MFNPARHRFTVRTIFHENVKKLLWMVRTNYPLYEPIFVDMYQICGHVRSKSQKTINPGRHRFKVKTMFPENMKKLLWILSENFSGQPTPVLGKV